jgi:hypothetical protein
VNQSIGCYQIAMGQGFRLLKVLLLCLQMFIAVGCATHKLQGDRDLLSFIEDGHTTKEQVELKLGEPTAQCSSGKIIIYRLQGNTQSGYQIVRFYHCCSLILVFDEQDILKKHSFIKMR